MLQTVMPCSVMTLDGKELVPAGALVTEKTAADIAALGRLQPQDKMALIEYGSVRADLERFLTTPPYRGIVAGNERMALLMGRLCQASLPVPILKALDYFHQHDFHTYHHILMVFFLSTLLAHDLFSMEVPASDDCIAGPVHDFGKICMPLRVLKKSSPLTRAERCLLNGHPACGYLLVSYYLADHRHPAALTALNHHERINGSGYPRGITTMSAFEEMIAVCDIYDALLSPRPYRPVAYDNRTALEELTRLAAAGEFSWQPVKAVIARNRTDRPRPEQVVISHEMRGEPPAENNYGLIAEEIGTS
jgi:HD-GYP domain-containing protein (c-di-GMP phosphodiesterase class II)